MPAASALILWGFRQWLQTFLTAVRSFGVATPVFANGFRTVL
jgi:hypothetical protein